MKLISRNNNFEKTLLRCINEYDHIYISVAWASANTKVFRSLYNNKAKIKFSTIGTHFCQTDPKVLESFIQSKAIHFITQPTGVFHPKVYLFTKGDEWEAIVGSANMTSGALTANQEISILISDKDSDKNIKASLLKTIKEYFNNSKPISKNNFKAYAERWEINQSAKRSLSGEYGDKPSTKPPLESNIMKMSWQKYSITVEKDPFHKINERIELLNIIQEAFKEYKKYKDMPLELRKTVAGLPNKLHENSGWFGSMKGFGVFHGHINNNDYRISNALDQIPIDGNITKNDYTNFINIYSKVFPGVKAIGTASRLLAMKRPDTFVCIDSKNKSRMCKDFGITISGMNYERYWDELICRIHDSVWWLSDKPKTKIKKEIWNGRSALVDCIFYKGNSSGPHNT